MAISDLTSLNLNLNNNKQPQAQTQTSRTMNTDRSNTNNDNLYTSAEFFKKISIQPSLSSNYNSNISSLALPDSIDNNNKYTTDKYTTKQNNIKITASNTYITNTDTYTNYVPTY